MLRFALLAVLFLGLVTPAAAEYPERALTIVVAYPAGGMVDIVARPMADSMKKKFTKGVAVLNRPGGGGSVGMAEVAQAKPDGYTVILAPNSTLVIHPQLNELPYKTPDDYEPCLARRTRRRRDGAARRGEAAGRCEEAPRAGSREPAAAAGLPRGADGQGTRARRRDRNVVRAHGPERNAGPRAEGAPRFREGRAGRTVVHCAHAVARRRHRLQERRQASP